jgi:hypothetical protein
VRFLKSGAATGEGVEHVAFSVSSALAPPLLTGQP